MQMMRKALLPAFASLIYMIMNCGCTNSTEQSEHLVTDQATPSSSELDRHEVLDSLLQRAFVDGDEMAYNEVSSYYELHRMNPELLYCALLVHNGSQNPEAAFDIYVALTDNGPGNLAENLNELDSCTKSMALFYLLRAYEEGFESAVSQVDEIYADSGKVGLSAQYARRP